MYSDHAGPSGIFNRASIARSFYAAKQPGSVM